MKKLKQVINFDLERENATRRMVPKPELWPMWPILPLKQNNHHLQDHELGYIFASTGEKIVVQQGNAFAPHPKTDPVLGIYTDVEALIQAGWRVD